MWNLITRGLPGNVTAATQMTQLILISCKPSAHDGTVCPVEVTEALGVENCSHTPQKRYENLTAAALPGDIYPE